MTDFSNLKKQVLIQCQNLLSEKRILLHNELQTLQEALENESKSSAGDKYETGIEMIQSEKEKIHSQMQTLEQSFKLLNVAQKSISKDTVQNGTLVITSSGKYLIGPSIGKVSVGDDFVFVISPSSPVAQVLINKKVKDKITFNENENVILEVC